MPVLMIDVAKKAGVSVTTVSHVMNETREIAPKTRERVLKAIKELKYYKNTSARLLVRGQSDIVGLIISDIENPFFPALVKSFDRTATASGFELLLGMTNYEHKKAEAAVRRMIESRVRGVAVMTSQIDGQLIDTLIQADIPVVALDFAKTGKGKSSLKIDYSTGIMRAVDHLYGLGHKEVAVIHGPSKIISASHYAEVLRFAIREYGMTLVGALEGDSRPEGGALAAETLLKGKRRPTAILCGNDLMAIGALGVASRFGIEVPHELSIIGADDIAMASYSHPSLSTIRVPRDVMGHEAFRLLENMYGPRLRRGSEACVATSFIARGSSGQWKRVRDSEPLLATVDEAGLSVVRKPRVAGNGGK